LQRVAPGESVQPVYAVVADQSVVGVRAADPLD
jgi:hypothetical protein